MTTTSYSYLALGDSYTVGEGIPLYESFPYQTVQVLRKAGFDFHAAEIVAKTGWTTGELLERIKKTKFQFSYDIVTLLIGVNNQYRGGDVNEYETEFEDVLKKAIGFVDNMPDHVIVLSIPDWSKTPFSEVFLPNAQRLEKKVISDEIDKYNTLNKSISLQYKVHYIDITTGSRLLSTDSSLLANDKLHPSGKEYERWAKAVSMLISRILE